MVMDSALKIVDCAQNMRSGRSARAADPVWGHIKRRSNYLYTRNHHHKS